MSSPLGAGEQASGTAPIACVGGVALDGRGRLLVVLRGHDPGRGLWSVPGGRVEPGESDEAAVVREVLEETGVATTVDRLAGRVDRPAAHGTFRISDYVVRPVPGAAAPAPGDDATDARWVTRAELLALPVVDGLVDALTKWGVLPD